MNYRMTVKDILVKLNLVKGKADKYLGLYDNPDFQNWKKEVVDTRLENLKEEIVSQKIYTKEGQENAVHLIALYQDYKQHMIGTFKGWKLTKDLTEKQIKKLKE